jgi:hypothetical protein
MRIALLFFGTTVFADPCTDLCNRDGPAVCTGGSWTKSNGHCHGYVFRGDPSTGDYCYHSALTAATCPSKDKIAVKALDAARLGVQTTAGPRQPVAAGRPADPRQRVPTVAPTARPRHIQENHDMFEDGFQGAPCEGRHIYAWTIRFSTYPDYFQIAAMRDFGSGMHRNIKFLNLSQRDGTILSQRTTRNQGLVKRLVVLSDVASASVDPSVSFEFAEELVYSISHGYWAAKIICNQNGIRISAHSMAVDLKERVPAPNDEWFRKFCSIAATLRNELNRA